MQVLVVLGKNQTIPKNFMEVVLFLSFTHPPTHPSPTHPPTDEIELNKISETGEFCDENEEYYDENEEYYDENDEYNQENGELYEENDKYYEENNEYYEENGQEITFDEEIRVLPTKLFGELTQ